MDTTLSAELIPADVLAKAARLALDTLVSILSDAKAAANERRIAALAVLRIAFPAKPRSPSLNEPEAPARVLLNCPSYLSHPQLPRPVTFPITRSLTVAAR